MRHATIFTAVLIWTLCTLPTSALAQSSGGGFFDDLGRTLFGESKTTPKKEVPRPSATRPAPQPVSSATTPRSTVPPAAPVSAAAPLPASPQGTEGESSVAWFTNNDPQVALPSPPPMAAPVPATGNGSESFVSSGNTSSASATEATASSSVPLHKRLSAFRESAFGESGSSQPAMTATPSTANNSANNSPASAGGSTMRSPAVSYGEHRPAPVTGRSPTLAPPAPATTAASTPTLAAPPRWATPSPRVGGGDPSTAGLNPDQATGSSPAYDNVAPQPHLAKPQASPKTPTLAPRLANAPTPETAGSRSETSATVRRTFTSSGDAAKSGDLSGETSRTSSSSTGQGVLFARQSPVLSVETVGPRRIAVGKESSYEMTVQNSGQVGADQVVVTIDLPDWADVLGAQASSGATNTVAAEEQSPRQFRWKVGRLEAKGREKLVLRIVPRQSRPFELAVKCDYTPVASQAMIEVQEAKLAMQLHGPREVVYGKPEVFRLELSNAGNGDAENVAITLQSQGPGDMPPASHQFGTLPAGERKAIEVELTARHTGTLVIKVDARAENGVEAHLAENILIRRANLQVGVEAPSVQFVGLPLSYRVRVSNPGNAPAQSVQVSATLPAEAKYVSSGQGGQLSSDRRKVTWTSDTLAPGGEAVFQLTCTPQAAGANRLEVQATAENELLASGDASTRVEAVANLAMNLVDPSGPVRVGDEAIYEIQVQNRGTKMAENVEVIAYFSNGIEPISAEGGRHRLGPGQVVFEPLSSVAAGQNVVLKIRARAETAGNHIFRAEVHCKPLGTRLVSEETTLFYGEPSSTTAGLAPESAAPETAPTETSTPAAQHPRRTPLRK